MNVLIELKFWDKKIYKGKKLKSIKFNQNYYNQIIIYSYQEKIMIL